MSTARTFLPKPVEAMQWLGTADEAVKVIDWVLSKGGTARYHDATALHDVLFEGEHLVIDRPFHENPFIPGHYTAVVAPSDFVVLDAAGEFFPSRADRFESTVRPARLIVSTEDQT